jgi:DNA topoisomerase-6 subunit B
MTEEDSISKQFKEHSIAEFFKKNRQMLGFSGKVRSLTIVIHELVTNSLDACEEAGIMPEVTVKIEELGEEHYRVTVKDNGPGIPKTHVGKALGQMLAGTKFHRYIQQRGQQGIGSSGCTMFSYITTGQTTRAASCYKGIKMELEIGIDFKKNRPIITEISEGPTEEHGLTVISEYKEVKYEKSSKGVLEYLRRTALANPHGTFVLIEPTGEIVTFPRAVEKIPKKPIEIKPHPLGIGPHDLLELCKHQSGFRKLSALLQNAFSRVSANKVAELRELVKEVDLDVNPTEMTWEQAEKVVNGFKQVKWIAPPMDALVPIEREQIEASLRSIFNPESMVVTERSPKVYRGGIPFMIEAAVAYGGGIKDAGKKGEIMRFANRVPLMFDTSGCAITETLKNVEWKRYGITDFEEEPIAVLVNLVSVHVPYTSAGKQAISPEEDVMNEIKFAVMEAARGVQRYLSGKRRAIETANKRKLVMKYIDQLSSDLGYLSGKKAEDIKKKLERIIEEKYVSAEDAEEAEEEVAAMENGNSKTEKEDIDE